MGYMPEENLTSDWGDLRDTIASDRFPLSPRIQNLKSALAKLDPEQPAAPDPIPPQKAWVNSSIGQRNRRR